MAEAPRYPSIPFVNQPILEHGVLVGFTVGITLTHEGQTATEAVDVRCGAEQAEALRAGPIEAYTAWSLEIIESHNLIARANAALEAKLAGPAGR